MLEGEAGLRNIARLKPAMLHLLDAPHHLGAFGGGAAGQDGLAKNESPQKAYRTGDRA
jgi:hypothetical protein